MMNWKLPTVLLRRGDWAIVRKPGSMFPFLVHDPQGGATDFPGGMSFQSHLSAIHYRGGKVLREYDLGSGLVTNVGVLAMANDFGWSAQLNLATLALANQHFTGTGATAAAMTDIKMQTISTQGGQTATAGTQTLISAANVQKYRTAALVTYGGAESVTEWGLMTSATLTATTGTPFTAGTATTGTVTASPLTASSATVRGQQQFIVENTASATPHWGLILSNSTSVFTVPAWYKVSDGTAAGTTPLNTEAFIIRPVLWDRKVFGVITVANGDSIQFTYTLTVTAGG